MKTACQDEDNIDEKKIKEVRGISLSYNYKIPPFLLESGRKCALCVGFDGDSIIPVPDFVKHSVPWVTNFYPPNRLTVNKCEGYKIYENRDTTSHLCGVCRLYLKNNGPNWLDIGIERLKNFHVSSMSVNELHGRISTQGKEIKTLNRKIKGLQMIIKDLKTKFEQNLHDNQVEHIDDGSTKEIIGDLFKSLEAREPGKAIDTILKQVLTEQAMVCTCNIY